MSIECICSSCRKRNVVPASAVGRPVKCVGCRETFVASPTEPKPAPAPAPAPAAPAESIGRFAVRAKLGAGAFGTVYRAYDPHLEREVAVKVPKPEVMSDPRLAGRFLGEAKAAANLRHPHIVPVFDAGRNGDSYFIASAFIDGKTLANAIPSTGMAFPRAARLVHDLAEALAYAHDQGIVHRDVKPQNMMLDANDHVHLTDFGLATRQEEESKLTGDGAVVGTPAYMSPEQATGQKGEAQPATDQYAAGVVLYELLTGELPFAGPKVAVLHQVIHNEPDPPSRVRPDVPKDLETICLKAMAKQPDARYANCHELAADLRHWLEGDPITARPMGLRERAVRWAKKEPKLAWAIAVTALVLFFSAVLVAVYAGRADVERRRADAERQLTEEARKQAVQEATEASAAKKRAETAEDSRSAVLASLIGATGDLEEAQKRAAAFQKKITDERETAKKLEEQIAGERQQFQSALTAAAAERERLEQQLQAARREKTTIGESLQRWQTLLRDFPLQLADAAQRIGEKKAGGGLLLTVPPKDQGWRWQHLCHLCDLETAGAAAVLKSKVGRPIAFSPDGELVAAVAADDDKIARVWETKTGKKVTDFPCKAPVDAIAFSPDGAGVVTAALNEARVWNAKTGASLLIRGTPFQASDIAFIAPPNPALKDQWRVVAVDRDAKGVRVWGEAVSIFEAVGGQRDKPADKGAQLGRLAFRALEDKADVVAVSPDGARVFARDGNFKRVWETFRGVNSVPNLQAQGTQTAAFAARPAGNGYRLATMGDPTAKGAAVVIWNANNGERVATLDKHPPGVQALAFSEDEERVATVSTNNTVTVWDLNTGGSKVLESGATVVALRPDGEHAAIANGKLVSVWNTETGKKALALEYPVPVTAVKWDAQGAHLAVGLADGEVHVFGGPVR